MTDMTVACAVCFGAVEPIVRESVTAGILVLLGVTAVVLGCFASFFVMLSRRARAAGDVADLAFGDAPSRADHRLTEAHGYTQRIQVGYAGATAGTAGAGEVGG